MDEKTYLITINDADRRVDRIIRKLLPSYPVSFLYKCLRKGQIRLNNGKCTPEAKVREGDELRINLPDAEKIRYQLKPAPHHQAADKVLKPLILYENKQLLVINKPRGLLVHGKHSLDEVVREYLAARVEPSLSFKPGPVHRLDRNTSGLVIFAASLQGAREMSELLQSGLCEKYYLALCDGVIEKAVIWEDQLDRNKAKHISFQAEPGQGQQAVTKVIPVYRGKRNTLALLQLITGRTHQIRIQAAIHGHPLTGDVKYRGSGLLPWYVLHAAVIRFKTQPVSTGFKTLTAPLPRSSEATLKNILNAGALKKIPLVMKRMLQ